MIKLIPQLILQIVILFVLLILYFSSSQTRSDNGWLKALVLAVALTLLGLLPAYLGIVGWLITVAIGVALISKITGESITSSILYLLILGIFESVIQLGIAKFL